MKKQLLIVDDDINLVNFISSYLQAEGFLVDTAFNVKSALTCMNNNKPDMILADIIMPNLDGYNFLEIVRSNFSFASIPIIFVTAKGMTSDRIYGYNLGCNAYITKPFNPHELVSIINNIFKNIEKLVVTYKPQLDCVLNDFSNSQLDLSKLTSKEKSVLMLLIQGLMNKEIAKRLNLSIRNVEKYVSRLLSKTQTRNRTELTQLALLHDVHINKKGE
uniref:TctD transcriptional regulator n=1 Tax=Rhodymenia pseudopalmata TaxID=31502 RepID=A0A1C9C7S2_RHOPU|nr:hypothetical protein Rhodyp_150 [Rhodymenia pseudopalmata]AOM64428.1 hypothetical protein Rhodyp_150 [Rhodymenia pseudopalmata]